MATSLIYSDCAWSINPINFGYPTIRSTTRTVISRCCMNVFPISATCCDVSMFWQFPDRLLCCSTPTINRYIRLQVIVWIIRASVTNSYGMSMCTSLFGCFCALIRTPWSWSRFCTTCVVFFYKSKSMRVIPACTNRYIVVMFRQFSDSFMPSASTYKLQARAACYCELFRCQYRQWLRCGCAGLPQGRCIPY